MSGNPELFVQVDSQDNVIGPIEKDVCHQQGILHRTVSVLVFNRAGQLLMQLRPTSKDLYPGLYTLSVTGHVDWTTESPETYEQAAQRECSEELGKEPVNPLRAQSTTALEVPGHHTMTKVYYTEDEGPFCPDPREVVELRFCSLGEVKDLVDKITSSSKAILERLGLI